MQKISRIVIDTNLWVSFLITQDYSKLDELLSAKQAILIFSKELLEEFLEVAQRPKFRRFFSLTDIEALIEVIYQHADFVEVYAEVNICRDPKDNFLLALAIDGNANYLLTGDKDLLELSRLGETSIVTISHFLEL
jgi:putative PIN family toxin of toxin-antitoxin system